ncbi:MAG TPA: PIG-L family deacetylase [Acidimicrobiales bacterium]|nr:PIG-L family deacetylase [Acidimicrobiales bacterium]
MNSTALHVSPHPDDEVLGCGATLLALRGAGWRVVNLACSLGRPAHRERRLAELEAAVSALGIEGIVADPPVDMSAGDDLAAAEDRVAELVASTAARLGADLVLSPHPDDAHHGHAVVGRAVARTAVAPRWWAWGLWRDLPTPNRYVSYGEDVMRRLLDALRRHAGEVGRNAYEELLPARARVQAILGSERVCGFGSGPASAEPFADLLEERSSSGGSGFHLARGHVVGLGELVDPHPDGRQGGADAVVDGVGDGP